MDRSAAQIAADLERIALFCSKLPDGYCRCENLDAEGYPDGSCDFCLIPSRIEEAAQALRSQPTVTHAALKVVCQECGTKSDEIDASCHVCGQQTVHGGALASRVPGSQPTVTDADPGDNRNAEAHYSCRAEDCDYTRQALDEWAQRAAREELL
jgi:hypothetical protein